MNETYCLKGRFTERSTASALKPEVGDECITKNYIAFTKSEISLKLLNQDDIIIKHLGQP